MSVVKTPVKVTNRYYCADGELRNEREMRCVTIEGCPNDATETDVVSNNGAEETWDTCDKVCHVLI